MLLDKALHPDEDYCSQSLRVPRRLTYERQSHIMSEQLTSEPMSLSVSKSTRNVQSSTGCLSKGQSKGLSFRTRAAQRDSAKQVWHVSRQPTASFGTCSHPAASKSIFAYLHADRSRWTRAAGEYAQLRGADGGSLASTRHGGRSCSCSESIDIRQYCTLECIKLLLTPGSYIPEIDALVQDLSHTLWLRLPRWLARQHVAGKKEPPISWSHVQQFACCNTQLIQLIAICQSGAAQSKCRGGYYYAGV